ncbi:hypothetical protein BgiBS90_015787 [Biomphalaria glabrata]|nr:hypothetical protein BgiBS90_015787 [Biomphalaria glabrata]
MLKSSFFSFSTIHTDYSATFALSSASSKLRPNHVIFIPPLYKGETEHAPQEAEVEKTKLGQPITKVLARSLFVLDGQSKGYSSHAKYSVDK